jgi:hypothetical protein
MPTMTSAAAATDGASALSRIGRSADLARVGDGLWVLEDESRLSRPKIGRVLACWDRASMVAHLEHTRRGGRG